MDQIEAYMELKWEEVYAFEQTPTQSNFRCITRFRHKSLYVQVLISSALDSPVPKSTLRDPQKL